MSISAVLMPVLFGYVAARLRRLPIVSGVLLFMSIVALLPAISSIAGTPDTVVGFLQAIHTPDIIIRMLNPILEFAARPGLFF